MRVAVPSRPGRVRGPSRPREGFCHNAARINRTPTRIIPVALGVEPTSSVGTLDEHDVALPGAVADRNDAKAVPEPGHPGSGQQVGDSVRVVDVQQLWERRIDRCEKDTHAGGIRRAAPASRRASAAA